MGSPGRAAVRGCSIRRPPTESFQTDASGCAFPSFARMRIEVEARPARLQLSLCRVHRVERASSCGRPGDVRADCDAFFFEQLGAQGASKRAAPSAGRNSGSATIVGSVLTSRKVAWPGRARGESRRSPATGVVYGTAKRRRTPPSGPTESPGRPSFRGNGGTLPRRASPGPDWMRSMSGSMPAGGPSITCGRFWCDWRKSGCEIGTKAKDMGFTSVIRSVPKSG